MKRDWTKHGDDYFHCKANFEAAKRGPVETDIANVINIAKESFDFLHNIMRKGLSVSEAIEDFNHDMSVDNYGLFRGLNAQADEDAREACRRYRVRGINPRY